VHPVRGIRESLPPITGNRSPITDPAVHHKRIELQRAAAVRAGGEEARVGVGGVGKPEVLANYLCALQSNLDNRLRWNENLAAVETAAGEMIVPSPGASSLISCGLGTQP
jgi:hypothetical protein